MQKKLFVVNGSSLLLNITTLKLMIFVKRNVLVVSGTQCITKMIFFINDLLRGILFQVHTFHVSRPLVRRPNHQTYSEENTGTNIRSGALSVQLRY